MRSHKVKDKHLLKVNRANKTFEDINLEEIMQKKWSIHAAIKSSLDLFGKKNKFNDSIENQEEKNEKSIEEESDWQVEIKKQRKIALLIKSQVLKRFKTRVINLLKKTQNQNAAKYLYQQTLLRKVLLSKNWNMQMDEALNDKIRNIKNHLSFQNKKSFVQKLKDHQKQSKTIRVNILKAATILKKQFFFKYNQLKQRMTCKIQNLKKQTTNHLIRSPKSRLQNFKLDESLKIYASATKNHIKKLPNSILETPKSNSHINLKLFDSTPKAQKSSGKKNSNQINQQIYYEQRKPITSMLEIKQGIMTDDLRNFLQKKKSKMFFTILKFKKSRNILKIWKNQRMLQLKYTFVSNLKIVPKINNINQWYLGKVLFQTVDLLKINQKTQALKTRLRTRFVYKMKRIVIEKLSQNREKKMLSKLCFNIIVSKKIQQLQEKTFQALKLNLQKHKIKTLLLSQLQKRNSFTLIKKCFKKWKHYRPEYLDSTCYDQYIQKSAVKNNNESPKRQREQTGANDLLKKEIDFTSHKIFLSRFKFNTSHKIQQKQILGRCSLLVQNSLNKRKQSELFSKGQFKLVVCGFQKMKSAVILRRNIAQLQKYLLRNRIFQMFSKKYIDPQKRLRTKLFLKVQRISKFFSLSYNLINFNKQRDERSFQISAGRVFSRLIIKHQIQSEITNKTKYLQEFLQKCRFVKSKYRLINQLKKCNRRSIKNSIQKLNFAKTKKFFKTLKTFHMDKMKQFYLIETIKRTNFQIFTKKLLSINSNVKLNQILKEKQLQTKTLIEKQKTQKVFKNWKKQSKEFCNEIDFVKKCLKKSSMRYFFNCLKNNHREYKKQKIVESSNNKIYSYAERKYEINLTIKAFSSLRQIHRSSKKCQQKQIMMKCFQSLRDNVHESVLLKRYLNQYQSLSYYPTSFQQKQQFEFLKQYV